MTLAKHEQVNAAVQEKHKKTEEDLNLSGQPCRIKKGQDVVLNEAGLIALSSSRSPEPMLQGRERADPAGEFNQGPPTRRRKVEPYHPPPFQNQESSEQDKKNEGEVEKNEEISQPVIEKRRGYHSEQKTRGGLKEIIATQSHLPADRRPRFSVPSYSRRATVRPSPRTPSRPASKIWLVESGCRSPHFF